MLKIQEIEVLSHAATLPEDERARPAEPPPAEVMQQLQKAAAALSTGRAEQMRATVFRPSHNLPTIALAEQASPAFQTFGANILCQLRYAVHGRRKKNLGPDLQTCMCSFA